MTRTLLRPSSTASSSVVGCSHSTDLRCAPSTSALTNRPRPRHYFNRPEFPELTGQNFRNLQPLIGISGDVETAICLQTLQLLENLHPIRCPKGQGQPRAGSHIASL